MNLLNFKCWICYVVDAFQLDDLHILQTVNSIDQHIPFIFDSENGNKLPLFNVLVTRREYFFFKICVYRKYCSVSAPPPVDLTNPPANKKYGVFYTYENHALKILLDYISLMVNLSS